MSVLEKLAFAESSNVMDWVDFYDWINRKDVDTEYTQVLRKGKFRDFTALAESLKGRWSKEFASITKVTNFLREIMNPQEKLALIKSIKYLHTVPELSSNTFTNEEDIKNYVKKNPSKTTKVALPACFELREYWKCYTTSSSGQGYCCDKSDCPIIANKGKMDKCFKDTIKTIYEWRSSFIHDAQLPPLREHAIYGVRYKGKYVIAELTTENFMPIFEDLVKKFFDKYQVPRSKKKAK
jgi:hypothetical protein